MAGIGLIRRSGGRRNEAALRRAAVAAMKRRTSKALRAEARAEIAREEAGADPLPRQSRKVGGYI